MLYTKYCKNRHANLLISLLTVQHLSLHYQLISFVCFALAIFVLQYCLHRRLRIRGAKIYFNAADVSF